MCVCGLRQGWKEMDAIELPSHTHTHWEWFLNVRWNTKNKANRYYHSGNERSFGKCQSWCVWLPSDKYSDIHLELEKIVVESHTIVQSKEERELYSGCGDWFGGQKKHITWEILIF